MKKILLINGSPRKGNCSIILKKIEEKFNGEEISVETIELRKLKLNYCNGCHKYCEFTGKCSQNDGINELLPKLLECDMLIVASPNYFQNVTGLTKTFFDRTSPLYHKRLLRGKKLFFIFVGGLDTKITTDTVIPCANGWARPMKFYWINNYVFQATDINKFMDSNFDEKMQNLLNEIDERINEKVVLSELTSSFDENIYYMFQDIEKEENGFINHFYGLNKEEYLLQLNNYLNESVRNNIKTYILRINDVAVGVGRIVIKDGQSQVEDVIEYAIAKKYRGKLYGNYLFENLLKECVKMNYSELIQSTSKNNVKNLKVLKKFGNVVDSNNDVCKVKFILK